MDIVIGDFQVKANEITVIPEIVRDAFLKKEGINNTEIHIMAGTHAVVYAQINFASATGTS